MSDSIYFRHVRTYIISSLRDDMSSIIAKHELSPHETEYVPSSNHFSEALLSSAGGRGLLSSDHQYRLWNGHELGCSKSFLLSFCLC
jgi:hypothetical protein